jgi:uncharacterized protein (DUF433 family)
MTTIRSATFPHIIRNTEVVGGEPVIEGTRVPVRSIVIHQKVYGGLGRITQAYPRVTRALAEEALAFYDAHREEIDRYIVEDETDEP